MRRSAIRPIPITALLLAVLLALALAATAAHAQVASLYYREVAKDGRIYVFNTPERYAAFTRSGDAGAGITLAGRGPNGETVVAENETALDLFLFRHDLPAYDRPTAEPEKAPASFPKVKLGGLWYLSYQNGSGGLDDVNRFTIKRGYINVEAKINDWLAGRITPDTTIDASGDIKVRLKYAYAKLSAPDLGFLARPEVEFGVAHMPWLDFEEHINAYRLQDTMFMERNGLFNSADLGVTFMALLGGQVSEEYQKRVTHAYPGRWGSLALGVYNGGGYHASERNEDKALEGRLTIRPLPDLAPGLQVSYFGVRGKGNLAEEPDFEVDAAMLSYEHERFVVTLQAVDATGNQSGSATDPRGVALERDGWSAFAEAKLTPSWSVIGRYDDFDPDTETASDERTRTLAGLAYHMGKGNTLLLDYDTVEFEEPGRGSDDRVQLTMQVKF